MVTYSHIWKFQSSTEIFFKVYPFFYKQPWTILCIQVISQSYKNACVTCFEQISVCSRYEYYSFSTKKKKKLVKWFYWSCRVSDYTEDINSAQWKKQKLLFTSELRRCCSANQTFRQKTYRQCTDTPFKPYDKFCPKVLHKSH